MTESVAYRKIQEATGRASERIFHGASLLVQHKVNDVRIFGLFIEYNQETIKDLLNGDQNL